MISLGRATYDGLPDKTIRFCAVHTSEILVQADLSTEIAVNFAALRNGRLRQSAQANGQYFTIATVSGLIAFGVPEDRIQTNVEIVKAKCVDLDVVVESPEGPIGLSLKTSLRERWAQADRAAMAIQTYYRSEADSVLGSHNFPYWQIFWSDDTRSRLLATHRPPVPEVCMCPTCVARAIEDAGKAQKKMIAEDARVVTVHDSEAMNELLAQCLGPQ